MAKVAKSTETRSRRGRVRLTVPELGAIDQKSSESAGSQVYALIRRAIMMGVFDPGANITGRSIAESLGVSQSPVRDALKRLEADGVIESRDRSAYYLLNLSREQYLEIMSIRSLLEGHATAEAAKRAKASDIKRLKRINDEYRRAMPRDSLRINFSLHFEIYCLAQMPILLELIENMWMRIGPVMHFHFSEYDQLEVTRNHAAIIEALERNDSIAARRALQRDLNDAARAIPPHLAIGAESEGGLITPRSTFPF